MSKDREAELYERVISLTGVKERLTAENERLTKDVEDLEQLRASIERLAAAKGELEGKVKAVTEERNAALRRVNDLAARLEALSKKVGEVSGRLEEVTKERDELRTKVENGPHVFHVVSLDMAGGNVRSVPISGGLEEAKAKAAEFICSDTDMTATLWDKNLYLKTLRLTGPRVADDGFVSFFYGKTC